MKSCLLFLAMNPGRDWRKGDAGPFAKEAADYNPPNPSAFVFNRALELLEYERVDVYVTNVVKCSSKEGNPEERHILRCMPNLKEEIVQLKPKRIIILWKGKGALIKNCLSDLGVETVISYHPAYFFRRYGWNKAASKFAEKLSRIIEVRE